MAARLNKLHQESVHWRFYVYEMRDAGRVVYVGKGSGERLARQQKAFGLTGEEIARFKREQDAYAFEIAHIAATAPSLNKHKGGNGSKATPIRSLPSKWEREVTTMGTRKYAARLLLAAHNAGLHVSKTEKLRAVAYG